MDPTRSIPHIRSKLKKSEGFTLIELLITIAILGVLSSGLVLIIDPLGQIRKAHDARKKSDLSQVQTALEQYYQDNNAYPANIPSSGQWKIGTQVYLQQVPQDPTSGYQYAYVQQLNGQGYTIYASLESKTDAQACNPNNMAQKCSNVGSASCGNSHVCNYGIASPNMSP